MKDEIPFNDWSKERITQGRKFCTSRHKKYKDKRVNWISPKLPLWFIAKYLWKPEGANSELEFLAIINTIYKRGVPLDEKFYVHFGDFSKPPTTDSKES